MAAKLSESPRRHILDLTDAELSAVEAGLTAGLEHRDDFTLRAIFTTDEVASAAADLSARLRRQRMRRECGEALAAEALAALARSRARLEARERGGFAAAKVSDGVGEMACGCTGVGSGGAPVRLGPGGDFVTAYTPGEEVVGRRVDVVG